MEQNLHNAPFVFFGTGPLAESVLATLVRQGYVPSLVVTKPDREQGRHMTLIAPAIKQWSEQKGIPVLQPERFDEEMLTRLKEAHPTFFIVASYGKILPENLLALPEKGTLNVHPSLLPEYRGPSPIESALLDGLPYLGISIMLLDKEMDHGPLLVQSKYDIDPRATAATLEVTAGQTGGELLVQVLPHYLDGTLAPQEQDHSRATFCKKITKEMGEITLDMDALEVVRKFRALTPWPSLYFFHDHKGKKIRVKIGAIVQPTKNTDTARDILSKVTPEGKSEITWGDFVRGYEAQ